MQLDWLFHAPHNLLSPPSVHQGAVYLTARQHLVRLDLKGSPVWQVRLPRATSGRPVPFQDCLLVSCEDGMLHHLRAANGSLVTSWELGHPAGREPAVEGDLIVATSGGTRPGQGGGAVTALAPDGTRLWRFSHDGGFHCTPALDGERVYCGNRDQVVRAFDRRDGRLVWSFKTGHEVFSTPQLAEARLLVTSNDGKLSCLDPRNGTLLWSRDFTSAFYGKHAPIHGDQVFVPGPGVMHALSLEDGSTRWQYAIQGDDPSTFTPAVCSGVLVFGATDGKVHGLDPLSGAPRWVWPSPRGPLGQQCSTQWTEPVGYDQALLLAATFTQVLYHLTPG